MANNLMGGSYATNFMTNITILRNSTAQFIDAVLIKSSMNYKFYVLQIISKSYNLVQHIQVLPIIHKLINHFIIIQLMSAAFST